MEEHLQSRESELKVQEGNITEPGESEATQRLRQAWKRYRSEYEGFLVLDQPDARRTAYFDVLAPAFRDTRTATQEILALNQDAMVRKSDALQRQSRRVNTLMVTAVVVALAGGLLASASLTQRAQLKNDLVATVAHEFRTPLTSLHMAIHLCLEEVVGPITPKQADLLFAAREDCERLQGIVDDLLDLSKLQSGRVKLEVRPVSMEEVLEAALAPHRAVADD